DPFGAAKYAAARTPGEMLRTCGGGENAARGCADRCGDESGSQGEGSSGQLSRRSLLPVKCVPAGGGTVAGTGPRHSASGEALHRSVSEGDGVRQAATNTRR